MKKFYHQELGDTLALGVLAIKIKHPEDVEALLFHIALHVANKMGIAEDGLTAAQLAATIEAVCDVIEVAPTVDIANFEKKSYYFN